MQQLQCQQTCFSMWRTNGSTAQDLVGTFLGYHLFEDHLHHMVAELIFLLILVRGNAHMRMRTICHFCLDEHSAVIPERSISYVLQQTLTFKDLLLFILLVNGGRRFPSKIP